MSECSWVPLETCQLILNDLLAAGLIASDACYSSNRAPSLNSTDIVTLPDGRSLDGTNDSAAPKPSPQRNVVDQRVALSSSVTPRKQICSLASEFFVLPPDPSCCLVGSRVRRFTSTRTAGTGAS